VDADFGGYVVRTDQSPANGGEGSAPEPFDLFLTSLATCVGIYVLRFCQTRDIPTAGMEILQHQEFDPVTKKLSRVDVELVLPSGFPEKYRDAVIAAANHCKVKQTLADPPVIEVRAEIGASH
jgi:ribosomal protein S12 methylthiotransferase accessory factor